MQVKLGYSAATSQLKNHVSQRTLQQYEKKPQFQTASPMPYANNIEIADRAETLLAQIAYHLRNIRPAPNLFFQANDIVPIPDIHGDFTHLIITLHRHGLLNCELDLKKDFNYSFLGDFYNRGKDADVVDYWLNKQIGNKINVYRISGNHELFFLARDENGNLRFKLRDPRDGKEFPITSNDVKNDIANNYQITEELLKSIKDGNLLAAYTALDIKNNIPILYAHTFVTTEDEKRLGVSEEEIISFVQGANEKFKSLGVESYKRFMDSKSREKFDWKEIAEPLFNEPLFNIFYRDKDQRVDAFFMRVTGLNENLKIISKINDEIPDGVYQIVGHTRIPDFDLPNDYPTNRPLILPSKNGKAFVQFNDIGMGTYYDKDNLNRPEVVINPEVI
ncbi:MAG: hypothetical protein HY094_05965 [Candidatus Melainabacteria bacterium]|nr:hypothetical protein [Candidatus Melainabacteria bacterium]